jgi:hypothetical protein
MLHIDLPTRADILSLTETRAHPAVTIYLATTPLTQAAQADRIALRNLAADAAAQLAAADTPKRAIWPIEAALAEIAADDGFWAQQANALAIFVTPEAVRTFRLPSRIPSALHISDRFHLKPLLRAVTFPHEAYVLAIGMGAVRLVEITADLPPHKVSVPGLPKDMSDAIGRRSHGAKDKEGRSGEHTSEHALMTRYSRAVDEALRPVLSGHESPLIVAAAEPMASIYRAVSSYPHTAAETIPGSADHTPDHELAAASRAILDGIHARQIEALKALYAERAAQGRATADIAQAARAATFGAVETLIVDMDVTVPGTVDADGAVTFAPAEDTGTYGVVDEIVTRALRAGARIVAARKDDIPGGGALAAVLRYAV